jgi:hypothetical protein
MSTRRSATARLGVTFLHRYLPEELGLPPDVPVWRDARWTEFQAFERWELLTSSRPSIHDCDDWCSKRFTPRTVEGLRDGIAELGARLVGSGT